MTTRAHDRRTRQCLCLHKDETHRQAIARRARMRILTAALTGHYCGNGWDV